MPRRSLRHAAPSSENDLTEADHIRRGGDTLRSSEAADVVTSSAAAAAAESSGVMPVKRTTEELEQIRAGRIARNQALLLVRCIYYVFVRRFSCFACVVKLYSPNALAETPHTVAGADQRI
jgi:hypothetical protein